MVSTRLGRIVIAIVAVGVSLGPAAFGGTPRPGPGQILAISDVSIIPMDRDRVLPNMTVLIDGDRILALGPVAEIRIPDDAFVLDGSGKFLIPGLADMHAHVRHKPGFRPEDYLAQGITVVRNMQGETSHLEFRDKVNAGEAVGPMMFSAGQALAGRLMDRRHRLVETPAEARAAVREQAAAGYDFIKVYSFLSQEAFDAILDEANKTGLPVAGHVSDNVGILQAVDAGLASVEHYFGYFWALEAPMSEIAGRWEPRRLFHAVDIDDEKLVEIARHTARANVWNCPTLWRKDTFLTSPLARDAWETPSLRKLGHQNRMKLTKALHDAGAGLLAGTDDRADVIHEELALFVEAGLTPYDSLRAATVDAARFLGADDDFGTVARGKRANLVLLTANPLQDIGNTRTIVGTIMNGFWLPNE